jgi:hypothetical protein
MVWLKCYVYHIRNPAYLLGCANIQLDVHVSMSLLQTLTDPERRTLYDSMVGFAEDSINPFVDTSFPADQVGAREQATLQELSTICYGVVCLALGLLWLRPGLSS